MKKLVLLLLLCTLTTSTLVAQTEFMPGHYVLNGGTKVDGYIKNEDWKGSPGQITFRTSANGSNEVISTDRLESFAIDGVSKFLKAKVNVDLSSDNLNSLNTNKNPEWEKRTIWLKTLLEGAATLYSYEDEGFSRFYFKKGDGVIEPLLYKRYMKDGDIAYNNQYQQQLLNSLSGCAELTYKDFYALNYKNGSLSNVFETYNNCLGGETMDFNKNRGKVEVHLHAKAGLNYTSIQLNNSQLANRGGDFGGSVGLRVAAEVEMIAPFNNGKWSIFLGVARNPNYESTIQQETSSVNTPTQDVTVTYSTVEIPVGFRYYMFLNERSRISLHGGYLFNMGTDIGIEREVTANDFEATGRQGGHFFIGTGYHFDRFMLEGRLDIGKDPFDINSVFYTSTFTSFNIMLGYRIL